MKAHGPQVTPVRIMAGQLDRAGREHETEEEELIGQTDSRRGWCRQWEEDSHETGFQQKCIPLKGEEFLPQRSKRKIDLPEQNQRRQRRQARQQVDRQTDPHPCAGCYKCIACAEPEDTRKTENAWQSPLPLQL